MGEPDRRPRFRLRQDACAQPRAAWRARGSADARPADPPRHQPKIDARPRPRPACRPTTGSDARDDSARDRRRHRHRPRPRRRTECPGGSDDRRDRPRPTDDAAPRRPSVTDRIVLASMQFEGRHGVYDWEQLNAQPFEVDVELAVDLQPAGIDDDLDKTIDYGKVYEAVRQIVESTSYKLLEALVEATRHELVADFPIAEVVVRLRKPAVQLGGPLDYAGVEIRRQRA